jgi:hypothetical protein
MRSDLGRVKGADVFLVFLESYGAVSWDRPALVDALAASRTDLDADIRDTGRRVVSALVESTTFGGKSWLAHISLLSGTEVRDEQTSVRLMSQPRRETMVSAFSRHGYRTVAIMPGDGGRRVRAADLTGSMILPVSTIRVLPLAGGRTDQFAIARMDTFEIAPRARQPVFISSQRSARIRRSRLLRRTSLTGVESSHAPPMTKRSWRTRGHRSPIGSIWGRVTRRRSTTPT